MADALQAKIGALSEAQTRERRFTADVAHELRTPLTAIVNEASLLAEHLERMPPEARRPAELLVEDVKRLRDLVEDLMEISRLDAGTQRVRLEQVDLGSLVAGALRVRGWDERVSLDREDVVVASDARRLERIVANLIGNALEHGGRDVSVRVGRDGVGAFVEVSDRGRGIAPDDLPHLFERFFKADRARTAPGSGLGLAIALENARLLGGDVDVWSELGSGSRFTLRLPVTEPLRSSEEAVASEVQDGTQQQFQGDRP
jgi:two-component system sensor histidine kinase MtrB